MSAAVIEPELSPELAKLAGAGKPEQDGQPVSIKTRKSRSGTSGAARNRAAKAATPGTPRPARASTAKPKIADGMARMYAMAGVGVAMVPSGPAVAGPYAGTGTVTQVVGQQLMAESGALGVAWEEAAKADPRIREALEKLLAVSTVGAIVAAHLPIVLHGLVAAGMAPPAVVGFADAPAPVVPEAPRADGQNTGGRP